MGFNSQNNRRQVAIELLLVITVFCATSCSNRDSPPSTMEQSREFIDETGRSVRVSAIVERVVSLAPNLTEIVYAIGAGNRLVGNTTYCDYPPEAATVAKVGDTLQPSIERIIALKPQLVLVSTASQLEAFTKQLNEQQISVYVTDPRDLEGVFTSIENVGLLLNQKPQAVDLVKQLRARTLAVQETVNSEPLPTVFYQLSAEPLYTAGHDAFVTDIIRRAGGSSVTAQVPGAWPRYSGESALAARPEVIILPTGGSMGEANTDVAASLKQSPAVLSGRVYKINGDYLVRPGPRSILGLEQMAKALHPEAFEK
jgi:iron complex transport system substrate-binding protein